MSRRDWLPFGLVSALALGLLPGVCRAQVGGGVITSSSRSSTVGVPGFPLGRSYSYNESVSSSVISPIYAPPGQFGMAYGTPSYGVPRTYSAYSSSYGAGYGYGYPPSAILPGRYGVGLWRPGLIAPGYLYGSGYYRTFPVPYRPAPTPPVGVYAPGFGPTLPGLPGQ